MGWTGLSDEGWAGPGHDWTLLGWTWAWLDEGRNGPGFAGPGLGPGIWHSFTIGPTYILILSSIASIIKTLEFSYYQEETLFWH